MFFICPAVHYDITFDHSFPTQQTYVIWACTWQLLSYPGFSGAEALSEQCTGTTFPVCVSVGLVDVLRRKCGRK